MIKLHVCFFIFVCVHVFVLNMLCPQYFLFYGTDKVVFFSAIFKEQQMTEVMKHSGDSSQQLSVMNQQLLEKDRSVIYVRRRLICHLG